MAEDGRFKSLRTPAMFVSRVEHREQIHMNEATSLFLQILHPLEDLELTGFIADRTFNMVLHQHGRTLLQLQFIPARE